MRITRDEWGLRLAEVTALRGTCLRRQVGCVLVDHKGVVLATGYNGVARGVAHCNEVVQVPIYGSEYQVTWDGKTGTRQDCIGSRESYPNLCPGADLPSGTGLDKCEAIHAEANALMQCSEVRAIEVCYVTCSPCIHCVKMLMNTSCWGIVFRDEYPHLEAEELWRRNPSRVWIKLPA